MKILGEARCPNQVYEQEMWMEFTKVESKTNSLAVGFWLFCLGALIVYLWEEGVSFMEMGGLLMMLIVMFALPTIAYFSERK